MARIWLAHLARLSMLASLLLTAGCAGSSLGDRVGQSLEADPQLVNNQPVADSNDEPDTIVIADPSEEPEETEAAEEETSTTNNSDEEPEEEASEPSPAEPAVVAGDYTDLAKAPEEVQPYLVDLIELDLLPVSNTTRSADGKTQTIPADQFRPNQAITRREYARWLLATNNRFYADQRSRKIRPGVTSSRPVFTDVPANDPDFGAIQGLAEAGIIPSPLTGSSTELTFRPDAPLTRKDLLLWKVPLDTRAPLPQATPTAVEQAWGFQDAAKIPARPLQAVLADFQNGDLANIRRAFGYTTLFQPDKAATRAETAAVLWRYGNSTEGITAESIRNPGAVQEDSEDDE